MCMIHDSTIREEIRFTVLWFVSRKKQFTGYDVRKRMKNIYPGSPRDISSYVRELFNSHDACFFQYGCAPVESGGPLLFFPIPAYVKSKKEKILKSMAAVAEQDAMIEQGG